MSTVRTFRRMVPNVAAIGVGQVDNAAPVLEIGDVDRWCAWQAQWRTYGCVVRDRETIDAELRLFSAPA
jgi:hypothetical protein